VRDESLPPALRVFAEAKLGDVRHARFCGWAHAESRVWRLETARGAAYLKQHRHGRKFAQELHAYLHWTPRLQRATPELLAYRNASPRALLLSEVPGEVAERLELGPQETELYVQAGRFLRTWHDVPHVDDDPVPLAAALKQRADAWEARAKGVIPPNVCAWVAARYGEILAAVASLELKRVPCHRDFTARNWLVDREDGLRLCVIDFEHARADWWLADVERLHSGVWHRRPALAEAFWDGYGRQPDDTELELLDGIAAQAALTTVVWAREHHDAAFERYGWATLGRLMGPRARELLP
jgi:Ser/Thr protein kinase RdoA (MazF antagonist)